MMSKGSSTAMHFRRSSRSSRFKSTISRNSSRSNHIGSQSRDSHLSKGSGQQEHNASSDGTEQYRLKGKAFFYMMRDYMQEVDQVLRQNTCTYHHIIKNSIKKQVEQHESLNDAHPLQEQLCYFKNIQASTRRLRRQLEDSIREKMLILHADWSNFLKEQYPELFKLVGPTDGASPVFGAYQTGISINVDGQPDGSDD